MPDLLGVTNPVPGHDNNNVNRNMQITPNDPRIQNAPDPTRVGRPDNRTEQQDTGDAAGGNQALRYDSNFASFLQRLMNTPGNIFSDSALYLRIYVWGLVFLFLYNIATAVFNGLGDSKTPLYFLVFSSAFYLQKDSLQGRD